MLACAGVLPLMDHAGFDPASLPSAPDWQGLELALLEHLKFLQSAVRKKTQVLSTGYFIIARSYGVLGASDG